MKDPKRLTAVFVNGRRPTPAPPDAKAIVDRVLDPHGDLRDIREIEKEEPRMPTNWNIRREEHSVAELEEIVRDARAELAEAERGGEDTREYREAASVLAFYQRRLDAAKEKGEQRKKDERRDAREIVDRIMNG